jgi:isocitrate dehydrogenase
MLVHVGLTEHAERVHNAWLRTIEDGIHTYDVYDEKVSKQKVGTKEFAEAVVERLGQTPQILKARKYKKSDESLSDLGAAKKAPQKELVGVDVFLDWTSGSANDLGDALSKVNGEGVKLTMISNRGVKVWPGGHKETFCSDHWRCRFLPESEGSKVAHAQVVSLLGRIANEGYDFIKTEGLYTFDGERGFSLDQGE